MPDNVITPEDFMSPEETPKSSLKAQDNVITPDDFSTDINRTADMLREVSQKGMSIDKADELFRLTGRWQADQSGVDRTALLAEGQSGWEQFNNFLGGSAVNFAAGFLDNFNYDIPDMANMIAGTEQEYGNWLTDITKDLREYSQEAFPIYEEGDDFGTPQYWAKFGQNAAYSVGLITGTLVEQAVLAATTGGLGNIASGIGKLGKAALFGSMKGIQEGYLNGLETFDSTKQKYLELGYNEEDAVANAAKAASLAYKMEVGPLMALNALQFSTIGKYNPFQRTSLEQGFGGAFESLASKVLPTVNNKFARGVINYGVNATSEGLEEGYQTFVSKYATDSVLRDSGDQFMKFDPWDKEMRDSILAGFAMGGVFKAAGDAMSSIDARGVKKQNGKAQDEFIANSMTTLKDDLDLLKTAQETKDINKIQSALYKLERGNVFRALNLDFINQKGTIAFDTHVNNMQQVLDAVEKGDAEAIKNFNLSPEDVSYVKDNYRDAIQDANSIKNKMVKNLSKIQDYELAALTTDSEFLIEKSFKEQNKADQNIQNIKTQNPLYQNLSSTGKDIFNLEIEKEAFERQGMHSSFTSSQKERYDEITNKLTELKKDSYEGKTKDLEILDGIDREEILLEESYKLGQQKLQKDATDRYKKYSSKEYQQELKNKRREETINNADSVEDLNKIKQDETITPEEEEIVDAKLEDAKVKENEKEVLNNIEPAPKETTEPIKTKPRAKIKDSLQEIHTNLIEEGSPKKKSNIEPEFEKGDYEKVKNLALSTIQGNKENSPEALQLLTNYPKLFEKYIKDYSVSDSDIAVDTGISFEPKILKEATPEQNNRVKTLIKEYVEDLKSDLGHQPTFMEFIEDFITTMGKNVADETWNTLVKGWELNNYKKPNEDYNSIWRRLFRDKKEVGRDIQSLTNELAEDYRPEPLPAEQKREDRELSKPVKESNKIIETNLEGQPTVYNDNPYIASTPNLKFAFKSLESKSIKETDEQGNIRLDEVDTGELLIESTDINSKKLLHTKKFKVGDKLTVRVPNNWQEIRVTKWVDDITKASVSPKFGEIYQGTLEDILNNPQAVDKIPLEIVDQDGEAVAFVTDTEWYNRKNVKSDGVKTVEEIIQEGRNNTRSLRTQLLSSGNREIEIEITDRSTGHLVKLKENQPRIPIAEANPQAMIGIATDAGELTFKGNKNTQELGIDIINKAQLEPGRTYDIREVHDRKYVALSITREKLSPEVVNNIIWATRIKFDHKNNQYKTVKDEIANTSKLNLYEFDDLNKYVSRYIRTSIGDNIFDKGDKDKEVAQKITAYFNNYTYTVNKSDGTSETRKLPVGTPYIIAKNFKFYIGRVGQKIKDNSQTVYVGDESYLPLFEDVLRDMKLNSNVNALAFNNENMFSFSSDGTVIPESNTYEDFLKSNFKTNVKSFNVGTEENPNYTTFVQPIINFGIASEIPEKKKRVEEAFDNPPFEVEQPTKFKGIDITQEVDSVIAELKPYDTNTLTEEELKDHEDLQRALTTLPGLQRKQQIQIIDYLFHMINKEVDPVYKNVMDKKAVLSAVKDRFYSVINETKKAHQETLDKAKNSDLDQDKINELEEAMKVYDAVDQHYEILQQIALENVYNSTGLEETQEITESGYQDNIVENGKNSASYILKRFLSGVRKTNSQGTYKNGFLGIPTFIPYKEVYNSLERIMTSPTSTGSSYDLMLRRLKEHSKGQKYLEQVIDYLENSATEELKNSFVYNFTSHGATFEMILWSKLRNGDFEQKVLRSNSKEVTQVIRNNWKSNFYISPLVRNNNGISYIDKAVASEMYNQFLTFAENPNSISNQELKDWLANFGITVSDGALNELRNTDYKVTTKSGKESKRTFEQMFENSPSTFGIFGLLGNYLKTIQNKENTEFEEKPSNDPFERISKALKSLSAIESKYIQVPTTNTFRDGGKNVSGILQTKHATDTVEQLKFDEKFRDTLSKKSYNKHSLVLQTLEKDANFRELFNINHVAITSIKENGKPNPEDHSVTSLPESDYITEKAGFFFNTEQGELADDTILGVPSRITRMMFPTMSDKTQMLNLSTIGLDLRGKDVLFTMEDDLINLNDSVLEVIYSQLVKPDLERIHNYHKRGTKSNVVGYDIAAQLFLFIPELNNIKDKDGIRAISKLKAHSTNTIEEFEKEFKQEIKDYLQKLIQDKTSEKYAQWSKLFLDDKGKLQFLDNKYFSKLLQNNTPEEALRIGAMDYLVNYMIHNANIHMLIAGDIALYANPKIAKGFVDGDPTKPKKDTNYQNMSRSIDANVGKRLANLLAPGKKLANSKGSEYLQIFLEDTEGISSNIKYVTKLLDGKEITDKQIEDIKNGMDLKKEFPNSSAYFNNATTDAQEYTTVKEHLDVLFGIGRIDKAMYESLLEKTSNENYALTDKEAKIIFQPIKPVYTGFVNDSPNDLMRMVYVKSSSFPLLPQLTKGLALDNLRITMEELQKETGKNVRASYQTANKVGSTSIPANIFTANGDMITPTKEQLLNSSLVLDRDNFRIQQDVPFKSGKRSEDVISLGTQIVKLLLGDGVTNIGDFDFDGEKISGKELLNKLNTSFIDYINIKTKALLQDFSKDENGNFTNLEQGISKIQELLRAEAIERGYPRAEVKALELESIKDSTGKVISFAFKRPIWLSNNADRYESLLNAIVTNRLAKIKLPGNSYVAGSEAGFKQQADFKGVDKSKIIYTSKWEGELKAAEIVNGELKKTQVFLPSKFRDNNGELIKFFDEKGKPNSTYVTKDEQGRLVLKEDMIDERLLNLTTFRIPTSSHVSMAQVEIVGLLPYESGDLMVVPKNLTTQKGLDFDIDKENTYQLWTRISEDGRIEVLENITSPSEAERLKLLENDIVKVHSAVLSNPSSEMQKKISSVLSMDFAEGQAELIDSINTQQVTSDFTPLSDSHQDAVLSLGAAGKLGIGVYSNYVVFHSLVQQSLATSNRPVTLRREDSEGNQEDISIIIGNLTSDGTLGKGMSLKPSGISNDRWKKVGRSITTVFAERQNTATDNAKAQIMGRVNVNEVTINVDSLMSLLGFDKDFLEDGTEVSIPYLFLSQPVIKDYVRLIKQSRSSLVDFDIAAKDKIINSLKTKYAKSSNIDDTRLASSLTGQKLFNNLTSADNNVQAKVLEIFLELDGYAAKIGELQNKLNITNGGLGKSFFETVNKYEYLANFQSKNETGSIIANTEDLIGDFQNMSQITPEATEAFLRLGYKRFGNNLIKPTTVVGTMLVNTVSTGYNLWADQFVSQEDVYKEVEKEILLNTVGEDPSDRRQIKTQEKILKEFKKFLYTSPRLNLFKGDLKSERERLFIDTEGKQSLATYLSNIIYSELPEKDLLMDNPLIAGFEYDLKKNGLPSLIKYSSTNTESYYEDYLYEALIDLYLQNKPLPDFNGNSYTTRDLVSDLMAYSYIGEPVQEGIQFLKYIPIELLDKVGATETMQLWNTTFKQGDLKKVLGQNTETISNFTEQFLRHNPGMLYKVVEETLTDKVIKNKVLTSFRPDNIKMSDKEFENISKRSYIAIYDKFAKKGTKKYRVYKQQEDGTFRITNPLGVTGLSEYNLRVWSPESSLYENYEKSKPIKYIAKEVNRDVKDTFNIASGNIQEVVRKVMEYPFQQRTHLNNIAKALFEYIPKDLRLEVSSDINVRGMYQPLSNTITISQKAIDSGNNEMLGNTIVHELIHALTVNFINNNPNNAEVIKLNALFVEAKKLFGQEKLNAFLESYKKKKSISFEERNTIYGLYDIKEFAAVAFELEFQEILSKSEYLASGKSLKEKFIEIINNILKKALGENYNTNGLNQDILSTIFNIIEEQKKDSDLLNNMFKSDDISDIIPLEPNLIEGYFEENRERSIFTRDLRDKLPEFNLCK